MTAEGSSPAAKAGSPGIVARVLGFLYGISAFLIFWLVGLYLVIFLGNFPPQETPWIEPTVDVGPSLGLIPAVIINSALLLLFGLQHSVMARAHVKAWIERFIPTELERSTYVHASNFALLALMVFWQPIAIVLWNLGDTVAEDIVFAGFGIGWGLLLFSWFTIGMGDLFGLRQSWAWLRNQPYEPVPFKTHWIYRHVRHPLYLGTLMVVWIAPFMTIGHVLFALGFTIYIAIGMRYEERDLVRAHGESYREYQRSVPALLPRFGQRASDQDA